VSAWTSDATLFEGRQSSCCATFCKLCTVCTAQQVAAAAGVHTHLCHIAHVHHKIVVNHTPAAIAVAATSGAHL
jgi:hypothetical protein